MVLSTTTDDDEGTGILVEIVADLLDGASEEEDGSNTGDTIDEEHIDDLDEITKAEMGQAFGLVPEYEKRDYILAKEEVPELVEKETPWKDFVWTESGNTYLAALRIARYWKARRHTFGEERWLRPLIQTGSGALDIHDIELLRSGFLVMMVRPTGGILGLMDFSKLPPYYESNSVLRVYYYIAKLFARESQKGYTVINVETGKARSNPLTLEIQAILEVAFPMKLRESRLFLVQGCFEPGREALLDNALSLGEHVMRSTTRNHVNRILGASIRQAQHHIQSASGGIEREYLPLCIGGSFEYKMYGQWIQDRVSVEFAQLPLQTLSIYNKLNSSMGKQKARVLPLENAATVTDTGTIAEDDNTTLSSSDRGHESRSIVVVEMP